MLEAAKKEGSVVVYTSTNEREGLPLFKIFEDATGIKVHYIRAGDGMLVSRSLIEARAGQSSFDVIFSHAAHKLPQRCWRNTCRRKRSTSIPTARDPDRRWHGVYANYNTPAYNTKMISAAALPKSYEEFAQRKEWAGKAAIDGTDCDWLKGFFQHFGEAKATQIIKGMVGTLNPVIHRRAPRARALGRRRRILAVAQQLRDAVEQRAARRRSDRDLPARSGDAVLCRRRGERQGEEPERGATRRQLHAQPGRAGTSGEIRPPADARRRESNPPGIIERLHAKAVVPVLFKAEDERKWQQTFNALFKPR